MVLTDLCKSFFHFRNNEKNAKQSPDTIAIILPYIFPISSLPKKKSVIPKIQIKIVSKRAGIFKAEVIKGGIIIPDTAKEKPIEGKVVAVGKGKAADDGKLIKPEVAVGDKVLFSKYGGTEVKIDGEEYLIMREEDILGIIEK